ncbi:hypothetical protein PGH07_06575 [Sulfurovum sp. zt1-1]|uniref:Uncharacterized protein n=1 Tax=Sulfurovum zhangzhouensis TaxID=3019067 RepID=A0ABT7R016_9BACT|nr:hypothetical protein [Sulfurovum zhangzhouensis]MDM5271836.1 hypothetical protein [Sulfurovum zhangzhouensis]
MKQLWNNFISTAAVFIFFMGIPASAALKEDLQDLVFQSESFKSELSTLELNASSVCAPLVEANQKARDMVNAISAVDESLSAPLQLDADILDALELLSVTNLNLANEALRLSLDLQQLDNAASVLTIKDGITAMLQLSDDIGTMADRIGEMADKILVMADNIDIMADRIVTTQEIQSANMITSTDTLLQTQTNALALVSVIETSTRALDYNELIADGMELSSRMHSVMLSPWTMKYQLQNIADDVESFREQVTALSNSIKNDSENGTLYIDDTTIMQLYDLSVMLTFIATAVDGYVIAIEGLEPTTSTPTLKDSLNSMLKLSADIGVMADRIGEMGDTILVMADNIGMVSDTFITTQQFQNANLFATQNSVLAAQQMAIAIIVSRGL